jgi:hypothetical protein
VFRLRGCVPVSHNTSTASSAACVPLFLLRTLHIAFVPWRSAARALLFVCVPWLCRRRDSDAVQ